MKVFYFGCWNEAGHFLHAPGGHRLYRNPVEYYGDHVHLDGTLAPRRNRRTDALCWQGMGATPIWLMSVRRPGPFPSPFTIISFKSWRRVFQLIMNRASPR